MSILYHITLKWIEVEGSLGISSLTRRGLFKEQTLIGGKAISKEGLEQPTLNGSIL